MARPAIPNPPVSLRLVSDPPPSHAVSVRPVAAASGRRYRLFVAAPKGPPPAEGFPALYLLDGNAAFDALDAGDLAKHPGLAVVAVGYETEAGFDFDARSRDYTPPALSGAGLPPGSLRPERPSGEAGRFLAALTGEIVPGLEAALPLDPRRRTLWGHSYGGLFALYALLNATGAFAGLAVASPTLWWDGGRILEEIADRDLPPCRVLLSRGDAERSQDRVRTGAEGRFDRLAAILARAPGVASTTRIFPGASHRAALDLSLPYALELAGK